jgi:hypothetical protein
MTASEGSVVARVNAAPATFTSMGPQNKVLSACTMNGPSTKSRFFDANAEPDVHLRKSEWIRSFLHLNWGLRGVSPQRLRGPYARPPLVSSSI